MKTETYALEEVGLQGFQLVKSQYFARQVDPVMTLWETAVSFGTAAYAALDKCEFVNVYVDYDKRKILIKPTTSKDPDAIKWIKNMDKPASVRLECTLFARHVFEAWKYDKSFRYRTYGKLVQSDKKVMLLFDFTSPEVWKGQKMVRENG